MLYGIGCQSSGSFIANIGKPNALFVFRGLVYIGHYSSASKDDMLYVTLRPSGHHTPNKVTVVHPAAHTVLILSSYCAVTQSQIPLNYTVQRLVSVRVETSVEELKTYVTR